MIAGIFTGRFFRKAINPGVARRLTMCAILLLLFLLGVSIGANKTLFAALPLLGWQALLLILCCLAGSIFCSILITPILISRSDSRKKKSNG